MLQEAYFDSVGLLSEFINAVIDRSEGAPPQHFFYPHADFLVDINIGAHVFTMKNYIQSISSTRIILLSRIQVETTENHSSILRFNLFAMNLLN